MLWFPLLEQTLHVLPHAASARSWSMLLVRLVAGADVPGLAYLRRPRHRRRCCGRVVTLAAARCRSARRPTSTRRGRSSRSSAMALAELKNASARAPPLPAAARASRGVVVAGRASACCSARFVWLQVVQHEYYHTLGRGQPHLDRADRAQPRPDPRPQRRGAGAQLLRLHARDHAAQGGERRARPSTSSPTVIEIPPQRPPALPASCCEESKSFESLPIRTRLTDEEVARFAANRYRFPGVEIKARLFRQYPHGEVASHVVGYIGRINDARRGAARGRRASTANYKGTDHIGKVGLEETLRDASCTAPPASSRSRSTPAAAPCARSRARRRSRATTSSLTLDLQAAGGRRARVRRPPRRAGGDRARRPAACSRSCRKPGFDPNLFVDGIDPQNWDALNNSPDQPLNNRALPARTRRARPSSRSWRWPRSSYGKRTPEYTISDPGYFMLPGVSRPLPRLEGRRPRHGQPAQVHRDLVRHLLLRARQRPGHRRDPPLHRRSSASARAPASTSTGELPGVLPSQEWKMAALQAAEVVRRRHHLASASARATTSPRRCSSPPAMAIARQRRRACTGRTSCSTSRTPHRGDQRAIEPSRCARLAQARARRARDARRWST